MHQSEPDWFQITWLIKDRSPNNGGTRSFYVFSFTFLTSCISVIILCLIIQLHSRPGDACGFESILTTYIDCWFNKPVDEARHFFLYPHLNSCMSAMILFQLFVIFTPSFVTSSE
ncbi:hypothetical protein BDW66DRAFT_123896 [Aspergillus desertorum]